jgi:hypothetical protein
MSKKELPQSHIWAPIECQTYDSDKWIFVFRIRQCRYRYGGSDSSETEDNVSDESGVFARSLSLTDLVKS